MEPMNQSGVSLGTKIEALLFWKGEPMKIGAIAEVLCAEESAIEDALKTFEEKCIQEERGIVLMRKDDEAMLGTLPEIGELLENLVKEELSKDLGKAALEALTVVLYKGPIAKSEIDYIRGVNSGYVLRSLLVRGLVEHVSNPERASGYLYRTSFELLAHLGLTKIEDLPEYDAFREKLDEAVGSFHDKSE